MKRRTWILLDFLLATLVAILGNIVAAYYQEQLRLTDPARFGFLLALFIISLSLLLWVTLKRIGRDSVEEHISSSRLKVQQNAREVNAGGSVTGIDAESLPYGTDAEVKQKARKVSGTMTGMHVGRFSNTASAENDKDASS